MAEKRKVPSDSEKPKCEKRSRFQTFKHEYSEEYPWVKPGKKGNGFAFCDICACDISIRSGGRNDVKRHMDTEKHKMNDAIQKKQAGNSKITGFFHKELATDGASSHQMDVIRAETMMVDLVTELNIPIASLDKINKVVKIMFKDSHVARDFQCGRSKGTAVLKEIAAKTTLCLAERMRRSPFTISTDGSNDKGGTKLFPLIVRTVDPNTKEVRSDALSLPSIEGSATGERIFTLIENELEAHNIPWENCMALGSDNANVMVGKDKGVYGFLLRRHPNMYLSGCVCHLIHIAAEKGAACLPLNISQVLIEVYYYLERSSKRLATFKALQVLHDLEEKKILKHAPTRWLSIGNCLPRLISCWSALYDFFKEQEAAAVGSAEKKKLADMKKVFASPTNKLYCLFLSDAITDFDKINTELQSDKPKLHILRRRLLSLLRQLLLRFVKPSAMVYKSAVDVDFKQACNVKQGSDLIIGQEARDFISNGKEHHLRDERIQEFYSSVQGFYKTSCQYILSKLPLQDELLKHAEVVDPTLQLEGSFSSLEYFFKRFPKLLPEGATSTDLQKEFAAYQVMDIQPCVKDSSRIDEVWAKISSLQGEDGQPSLMYLPSVVLSILTVPHSSAHCERIFSIVRKNKTEFRGGLKQETLEAMIVAKSRPGDASERSYKNCDLKDFKSAYYRSLKHN